MKILSPDQIDRIIEMAWEDRTPFDVIEHQFGLTPGEVIDLMRREMKPSSFKRWRKRTDGRTTKHSSKAESVQGTRFKCSRQRSISSNRIT
jgi:uncharacterized protein (TIGR03643 family)